MTVEHSTILIAVATVIYMLTTIGLFCLANRSIALTKTIFEATNRPFVGLSTIDIVNNPALQILAWTVAIENAGNSPAASVEITYHRFLNGECEQTTPPKGLCTILPGNKVYDRLDESRKDIYESTMTEMSILEFAIHIKYQDIHKNNRATHSRYKYNVGLNVFDLAESSFT